jgi:hypothetical protein
MLLKRLAICQCPSEWPVDLARRTLPKMSAGPEAIAKPKHSQIGSFVSTLFGTQNVFRGPAGLSTSSWARSGVLIDEVIIDTPDDL